MAIAEMYKLGHAADAIRVEGSQKTILASFAQLSNAGVVNSIKWIEGAPGPMYRSSTHGLIQISDMAADHAANAAWNIFVKEVLPRIRNNPNDPRFGRGMDRLRNLLYGLIGVKDTLPAYNETYAALVMRAMEAEIE